MKKVFKITLEANAKTKIYDSETIDDDTGESKDVLFTKKQVNQIIIDGFIQSITQFLESLDEDRDLGESILDELHLDNCEYSLVDIAEVKISF